MTQKYSVSIGLVVRDGERTYEFDRRLNDDTVIFINQIDRSPKQLKLRDLYKQVQEGRLVVVSGDDARDVDKPRGDLPLIQSVEDLPEKHRDRLNQKADYIRRLKRRGLTRGMRKQIGDAIKSIASDLNDPRPPSVSTIAEAWRKLDRSDGVIQVLITGHVSRKRTKRKQWAEGIVREWLRKVYFTRERRTLQETLEVVNQKLSEAASRGQLVAAPDRPTISMSGLRRYLMEVDPYVVCVSRYGRGYADNKWRYSLGGKRETRVLQNYQIDHTILNIVVVCDTTGMPLGRPTITLVMDSHSSYPAGFFVSFWGAGLPTTLAALKVAFAPKGDFAAAGASLEHQWLAMGVCEALTMDNGLEFHSPRMHALARQLEMDLLYCPVRKPWWKPVVERTLGTMNLYLPSSGKVEKQLDNYIPLKPESTACVSFSALAQGLLKIFVDVLPTQVNERKLARPYDLFKESFERMPPPMLMGRCEDLDVLTGVSTQRVIGGEGVIYQYLRFNSPELQAMRRILGGDFRTEVRFNPHQLSHVYARVPDRHEWLVVPSCSPEYTNWLSLVQHKAIRGMAGKELTLRNAEEVLQRMKSQLRDHWEASVSTGKRLASSHLKALSGLTSAHVLQPGSPQILRTTQSKPVLPISKEDLQSEALEIPDFESEYLN